MQFDWPRYLGQCAQAVHLRADDTRLLTVVSRRGAHGQQLLRVLAALLVSVAALLFVTRAAPYKRLQHDYLSIISSLALICVFLGAIIVRLHGSISVVLSVSEVEAIIGVSSVDIFATLMIIFFFSTFLCMVVLLLKQVSMDLGIPILRCEDGSPPNLTLDKGHLWHGFISHTWATGQDQSANMKRLLLLLLPGCSIFLVVAVGLEPKTK